MTPPPHQPIAPGRHELAWCTCQTCLNGGSSTSQIQSVAGKAGKRRRGAVESNSCLRDDSLQACCILLLALANLVTNATAEQLERGWGGKRQREGCTDGGGFMHHRSESAALLCHDDRNTTCNICLGDFDKEKTKRAHQPPLFKRSGRRA